MRVITGSARGRRLREPEGNDIRPTTGQVKEAMFNICQFDVEGRRVLDLFGGTGQLGIEAASRGAAAVDIVDSGREAIKLIRENVRLSGLDIRVHQAEALSFLASGGPWDLILLDPPYHSELAKNALERIKAFDKLSIGGIIICETDTAAALPALDAPYERLREYRYGKVKLTTYKKS
ncbi:MAG: 16S rRNA (guanine(966)-N(2))-methyltransferase RsmD [Oscillospiraceae bacterium]|nr:16S rRNA (guanine(966)-N(2))-methyltransferase RsmD [Oscillospiraceae bacterium]